MSELKEGVLGFFQPLYCPSGVPVVALHTLQLIKINLFFFLFSRRRFRKTLISTSVRNTLF